MVKIRVKHNGKYVDVWVVSEKCKDYDCLAIGKYRHMSKSIDGTISFWEDDFYSCLNNAYHGCSDKPKLKESLK